MNHVEVALKLKHLFFSYLDPKGFVLVDLRFFRGHHGESVLEVLVDRLEGGITMSECADIHRNFREVVERSGCLADEYALSVSSPGLDRPLVGYSDFLRMRGREVNVFLKEALDGRTEYRGVIESVEQDKIVIRAQDKKEIKTIEIPLNKVNKAKQVIL